MKALHPWAALGLFATLGLALASCARTGQEMTEPGSDAGPSGSAAPIADPAAGEATDITESAADDADTDDSNARCRGLGSICIADPQCCSHICHHGHCRISTGGCRGAGQHCSLDGQCCSGNCLGGLCTGFGGGCLGFGRSCFANDQCCSGECRNGHCGH